MEKLLLLLVALPFGIGLFVAAPAAETAEEEVVLTFADDRIVESSGLVARDDLVVTVNDSGDGNRIFTVDPTTGETVGVTEWQGEADDIEALAPAGEGEVYAGDIGDNAGARDSIEVARVPFGRGEEEVDAATYDLVYPDGPHDAETLLVHPRTGQVFVVAKEFIGRIYAAPQQLAEDGDNQLTLVDEVVGIATDGAFLPDGRHIVLRTYGQAAYYTWPALDRVSLVDLPPQQQGEGIAVSEDGEVLISTEGAHTDVLRVDVPAEVRQGASGSPSGGATGPSGDATATPEGQEPESFGESSPVEEAEERSWWPWALGGVAGVVIIVVLLRSLRPR